MLKITILLFLFSSILADPRCPFQTCDSTYDWNNACSIYCRDTQFPDRGNQTTRINYLHFTSITKMPANAFKNLEIQNLRIQCSDLSSVHDKAFEGILNLNNLYLVNVQNISLFFTGELDPLENLTASLSIDRGNLDNDKLNQVLKDTQNWSQLSSLQITNNNFQEINYDFNNGFKSLTNLYLSYNGIEKFNISSNKITTLGLYGNLIKNFSSEILRFIPNLSNLDLTMNQIETFQFIPKMNLASLSLSNNKIRVLTNQTFENLVKVQYLYLSSCFINQIETGTFCKFENLQTLILSNNDMSSIKLNCLENVLNLQLSNVNYSGLITQELVGNPVKVQYLYLSSNNIERLELKNLTYIQYLFLNYNNLKNLSNETIRALSSINYIDLSNNKFDYLGILAWKNVQNFYIRNNMLKEIQTKNLEFASTLVEFDASYNLIEKVQMPDLDQLRKLDLTKNKIREIKKYHFMSLKNLVELHLDYNLISKIETKSFDKNIKLQILLLNNNMLTTTPDISKLTQLGNLNLNDNRIVSLPNNAFERNISEADIIYSKIEINLNGNNITSFSSKTFCSQYTYSLGFMGVSIYFDDLNKMNMCLLEQLSSDDTNIYSSKKANCDYKAFSKLHNIDLIDGYDCGVNLNITYDECKNETMFKCPNSQEIVRFTSWITGDPHVYSYKNKYELCTLGEDAVCFQHDDYVLLCSDKQVGRTNSSATVLTELEFIYSLSNETNVTFTATENNFPRVFSNKKDKIYANDSENEGDVLVELIKYPDMRIIFINESKTHIFITKYGSFYSVTLRTKHETYAESSGVLYEGCENEMKNVSMRRKRSVQNLNCSMECAKFNFTLEDENMPDEVLRDACEYDCENVGAEGIVWMQKTEDILNLMNQSDNTKLESSLISDLSTTTSNFVFAFDII